MNIDNLVDKIILKNNIKQRAIQDKNEARKKEKQIKRRCLKLAFDHALCHYDGIIPCLILFLVFAIAVGLGWCISGCFTSIICMFFLIPTCICFGSTLIIYIKNCIKEYKYHILKETTQKIVKANDSNTLNLSYMVYIRTIDNNY